jgi:hypothetical protein
MADALQQEIASHGWGQPAVVVLSAAGWAGHRGNPFS